MFALVQNTRKHMIRSNSQSYPSRGVGKGAAGVMQVCSWCGWACTRVDISPRTRARTHRTDAQQGSPHALVMFACIYPSFAWCFPSPVLSRAAALALPRHKSLITALCTMAYQVDGYCKLIGLFLAGSPEGLLLLILVDLFGEYSWCYYLECSLYFVSYP